MLKLDMAKAYNSIEWSFMESVLKELGFPYKFIGWIMRCISSVSYSVLVNGIPSKPFAAKKGLRQVDPMSPFLFALAMEYFSRMLKKVKGGDIKFHPKCGKTTTMEHFFVDDSLIFTQPDISSFVKLRTTINDFVCVSGLYINSSKSAIYFAGVPINDEDCILNAIGVPKGAFPFHYLGFPRSTKRLDYNDCKSLVDRIAARVTHWTSRQLSMAGRVQLVNSFTHGMHSY